MDIFRKNIFLIFFLLLLEICLTLNFFKTMFWFHYFVEYQLFFWFLLVFIWSPWQKCSVWCEVFSENIIFLCFFLIHKNLVFIFNCWFCNWRYFIVFKMFCTIFLFNFFLMVWIFFFLFFFLIFAGCLLFESIVVIN